MPTVITIKAIGRPTERPMMSDLETLPHRLTLKERDRVLGWLF